MDVCAFEEDSAGSKTKVQRSTPNSDGTKRLIVSIGMVDDNIHKGKGKGSRSV